MTKATALSNTGLSPRDQAWLRSALEVAAARAVADNLVGRQIDFRQVFGAVDVDRFAAILDALPPPKVALLKSAMVELFAERVGALLLSRLWSATGLRGIA